MFKRETSDDGVMRLIPKQKKGFFRLIFSRFFIILILLGLEVLILFLMYQHFEESTPYFNLFFGFLTVVSIIWLFNGEMDSTVKLTWMMIFFVVPIPGTILFVMTQTDFGHYAIKRRVGELIKETKNLISQDKSVLEDVQLTCSGTDDLCRYVNNTGCFPIYTNTETEFLASGEEKFSSVLEELEKAEKFIFMEYFIIDEGYMWGKILEMLKKKASQGVEIRVMYDGMCEMSTLTPDYPKRMAELGVKCKDFSPITPFLSTYYNYRDHRKILVIDGKIAFTGGINFADEYINKRERFGHWKDSAVMLKGEAVQSFTLMFLQMWNISEKNPEWDKWLKPVYSQECGGFVMPYGDCPLDDERVGENVYIDILNRATSYVHIMTPYLILDSSMENALKYAAHRGIDVKIILPGIPDKKTAFALAKTHYKGLINAGVKIYEYTPGFVHSKICVSDDEKAVVGTINFDYRSLYHHFECAAYMYRTSCILDIEDDFSETLKKCRQVTPETIKKEKLYYKITGQILKFIAPLF